MDWERAFEEHLGQSVAGTRPLGGGCVGEVYRVALADGASVVAKVDRSRPPAGDAHDGLAIEGYMLRLLRARGLPVPGVLHSAPGLLVMEDMPGDSRFDARAERHAAELLAALHGVAAPRCGLDRDTLIGGLRQPNPWTGGWVAFFTEHRLLHMARAGHREGAVPAAFLARIGRLAARLPELLEEPDAPALLHGDVWTTNVLAARGRVTAFLDPAVYHGHPEIELAFITLFNTFGRGFFDAYHALRPIRAGFFEARRDLYNLYPLLAHVRLFGAGYLGGIDATLRRHGC